MVRSTCYRCRRPQSSCLCALSVQIDNRTEVLIVQHIREFRHPLGTVRIAMITLNQARCFVTRGALERPVCLKPDAVLLFPGEASQNLRTLAPQKCPSQLVVIDGTWNHARIILRANPWLQKLPRVSLTPDKPGAYIFRKEPNAQCLSTIEAIVAALKILEPDTPDLDNPIQVFDEMVRQQVDYIQSPICD